MLSIEKIENIIKPNKKHYEMRKDDTRDGYIFFFDNDFLDSRVELLNNEPDKLRLYLAGYYKINYRWLEMTIENNAIELKHYLNIKITKQDMIDWIKTFKSYKILRNHEYNISEDYLIIEDKEELSLFSKVILDDDFCIFTATNSQEYWRLYNIVKNLKE